MQEIDQLAAIDRHLRKKNWLLNEELIAELTDHYAAGIADRIATGMTFDAALQEIHTGFGGRKGLLKMEEEKKANLPLIIGRELKQLIGSYFHPPRLSLTISFVGVAYWMTNSGPASDWLQWSTILLSALILIPIPLLFIRTGYLYVGGKKNSMQPFTRIVYRYFFALNLLTILNFLWGSPSVETMESYSRAHQMLIFFTYLLVWSIIMDFAMVQQIRKKVFA